MADAALEASALADVLAAIQLVGITAQWEQDADPDHGYTPSTGATTPAWTPYAVTISPPVDYEQRYLTGDLIQAGDAMVVLPASGLTITPRRGDRLVIGSTTWRVVSLRTHQLGNTVLAFEAQIRR